MAASWRSTIDRPSPTSRSRPRRGSREKERIAARAVGLLAPDDTIYLDSGSTVLAVRVSFTAGTA